MPLPVSLKEVIEEMDMQNDMISSNINRKTGELIIFTEEDEMLLNELDNGQSVDKVPEWQREIIPKLKEIRDSEDFLALPSSFEIHEYEIMEHFIMTMEESEMKEKLLNAIRGRGAFGRFKDKLYDYNLWEDWNRFKERAIKKIAVGFLEHHGIPYKDDVE